MELRGLLKKEYSSKRNYVERDLYIYKVVVDCTDCTDCMIVMHRNHTLTLKLTRQEINRYIFQYVAIIVIVVTLIILRFTYLVLTVKS